MDLYCDDKLFRAFQGTELSRIIGNAYQRYAVNFTTLFSFFARRRKRESDLKQFLVNETESSSKYIEMIDRHSLSREWLEEKRKAHKKDPGIIESMIYALHALEELRRAVLDIVFKGGTSLILLLDNPRRFSVDIIVKPAIKRRELLISAIHII